MLGQLRRSLRTGWLRYSHRRIVFALILLVTFSIGYAGKPLLAFAASTNTIVHPQALPIGLDSALVKVETANSNPLYTQQSTLIASDGGPQDDFGASVALSSDGNTALVGAPKKSENQGAVYVFSHNGNSWMQQAELTSSDGKAGATFGTALALSRDGTTAVITAYYYAAYVFTFSGGSWTQQAKLTPNDGSDSFGNSVALSSDGRTAIIGAQAKKIDQITGQGAAYVFSDNNGSWIQQTELTDKAGQFGSSVALSGDGTTAMIGADGGIDGVATFCGPQYGIACSIAGAVYVYSYNGTGWIKQAAFNAGDPTPADNFGWKVALSNDGNTAVITAWSATVNGQDAVGGAYVFTRQATKWKEQHKLTAPNGKAGDFFGSWAALSANGNVILIASMENPYYQAGKVLPYVYPYVWNGLNWAQGAELPPANFASKDYFGRALALSSDGSIALMSGTTVNSNETVSTVYVFAASPASLVTPTPMPTSAASACFPKTPPRLTVGGKARITPGSPNNLRDTPNRNGNLIGTIPGGAEIQVLAGPVCDSQDVWWQVAYQGQIGWTPESDGKIYFVIPE